MNRHATLSERATIGKTREHIQHPAATHRRFEPLDQRTGQPVPGGEHQARILHQHGNAQSAIGLLRLVPHEFAQVAGLNFISALQHRLLQFDAKDFPRFPHLVFIAGDEPEPAPGAG